jgi:hypothetical protein
MEDFTKNGVLSGEAIKQYLEAQGPNTDSQVSIAGYLRNPNAAKGKFDNVFDKAIVRADDQMLSDLYEYRNSDGTIDIDAATKDNAALASRLANMSYGDPLYNALNKNEKEQVRRAAIKIVNDVVDSDKIGINDILEENPGYSQDRLSSDINYFQGDGYKFATNNRGKLRRDQLDALKGGYGDMISTIDNRINALEAHRRDNLRGIASDVLDIHLNRAKKRKKQIQRVISEMEKSWNRQNKQLIQGAPQVGVAAVDI